MHENATTRDEILGVALELFRARGYDGTSLRQIAERLGFTKAALYYHFPAKEHLIVELTRPFIDAISHLLAAAASHEYRKDDSRHTAILGDYLDVFVQHHDVLSYLAQDVAAMRHPDVGTRMRALILALQSEIAGEDAGQNDRVRVACAFGVIHAVGTLSVKEITEARGTILAAAVAALHARPLAVVPSSGDSSGGTG